MDPLGSRDVRGLVARNRRGFLRLCGSSRQPRGVDKVDRVDKSTALGEFLERQTAMSRVEEVVEASMGLVLHDWELYRTAREKR